MPTKKVKEVSASVEKEKVVKKVEAKKEEAPKVKEVKVEEAPKVEAPLKYGPRGIEVVKVVDIEIEGRPFKKVYLPDGTTTQVSEEDNKAGNVLYR